MRYPDYVLRWVQQRNDRGDVRFEPEIVDFWNRPKPLSFGSKEDLIRALEEELRRLKAEQGPKVRQEDINNLPTIGTTIWAIEEYSDEHWEVLDAEVTEYAVIGGVLCVVIGFYYRPHDEVFRDRATAEAFLEQLRSKQSESLVGSTTE
jgi:hypothetical protein